MTQGEKKELIDRIFKRKAVFEKEVLNIVSDSDRAEIMQILSKFLVRDSLKEELNFLYMEDLSKFTFKPVVNILFKEIANEWIFYAMEELGYTKNEALVEIQTKKRVLFIRSLVSNYYKKYQRYIFKEIADTFIELVKTVPHAKVGNRLVDEVLKSDLIVHNNVLAVYNFRQLWGKVKAAQNLKNADVSRIQIFLNETSAELESENLDDKKREELLKSLKKYENDLKKLMNASLDTFDGALKRFKETLISSIIRMNG